MYRRLASLAIGAVLVFSSPAVAQHFTRLGDATGGEASWIKLVRQGNLLVTGVRDGAGRIKLIAWQPDQAGNLTRRGDVTGPEVRGGFDMIALGAASDGTYGRSIITAAVDTSGNLLLNRWFVSDDGQTVELRASGAAGEVSSLSLVPIRDNRPYFATAVRDGAGNLKLIEWGRVTTNDPTTGIVRREDVSAGAVTFLAAAGDAALPAGSFLQTGQVVTALRDSANRLRLIEWEFPPGPSNNIRRGATATAGEVLGVDVLWTGPNRYVTSVQDADGNLKLILWSLGPDGFTRLDDASAGQVFLPIDAIKVGSHVITGVQDGSGNLRLIAWAEGATSLTRRRDIGAGAIQSSSISMAPLGLARLAVAVIDAARNLKVIVYQFDQPPL